MKKIGMYMLFFGIGSALLSLAGCEFVILSWINSWGTGIAWAIRLGLILGGAGLTLAGRAQEGEED